MGKSTKIRQSARDKDCTVRIPGVCNHDSATTIHAHKNGGGMGMKENDLLGARCCSSCHDAVDGRVMTEFSADEIKIMFYEGIFRTQKQLIIEGLVKC